MNASGPGNSPLMDEDSFADPEMGFGEQELTMEPLQPMVHDVQIDVEPEPATLASDANAPLDVEPDPELGSTVDFTDQSPALDSADSKPEIDAAETDELQLELQSLRAEIQGLQDERAGLIEKTRELQEQLESAAPAGELSRLQGQLNEAKKLEWLAPMPS